MRFAGRSELCTFLFNLIHCFCLVQFQTVVLNMASSSLDELITSIAHKESLAKGQQWTAASVKAHTSPSVKVQVTNVKVEEGEPMDVDLVKIEDSDDDERTLRAKDANGSKGRPQSHVENDPEKTSQDVNDSDKTIKIRIEETPQGENEANSRVINVRIQVVNPNTNEGVKEPKDVMSKIKATTVEDRRTKSRSANCDKKLKTSIAHKKSLAEDKNRAAVNDDKQSTSDIQDVKVEAEETEDSNVKIENEKNEIKMENASEGNSDESDCSDVGDLFNDSETEKDAEKSEDDGEPIGFPLICNLCPGKIFDNKKKLRTHQLRHTHNKTYVCYVCGKCFSFPALLTKHLLTHNEEKSFACGVCGKAFAQQAYLVKHSKIHMEVDISKMQLCSYCGKGFMTRSLLINHERIHTNEKPFSCPICSMSFADRTTLTNHLGIHSDVRSFSCDVCDKSFKTRSTLYLHKKSHSEARPYTCATCGTSFKAKNTYVAHQKIHSGERPFVCEECGRGFLKRYTLSEHKKTHTGERPFLCDVCGKGFSRASEVTRHMKVHQPKPEFTHFCDRCQKGFKTSRSLIVHMRQNCPVVLVSDDSQMSNLPITQIDTSQLS